jgi:hypothetical protein
MPLLLLLRRGTMTLLPLLLLPVERRLLRRLLLRLPR